MLFFLNNFKKLGQTSVGLPNGKEVLPTQSKRSGVSAREGLTMITSVGHAGIVVKNMDKMVTFYKEVFGFEVIVDTRVGGQEADEIVGFHVESERIVLLKVRG